MKTGIKIAFSAGERKFYNGFGRIITIVENRIAQPTMEITM
jgi:hypothetical protein